MELSAPTALVNHSNDTQVWPSRDGEYFCADALNKRMLAITQHKATKIETTVAAPIFCLATRMIGATNQISTTNVH